MAENQSANISRRSALLAFSAAIPFTAGAGPVRSLKLSAKTLGGETLDAASLKGKPVLVQFWTTWCTFCQSDEGPVESIIRKLAPKGLVVIGVNAYETRQKVQEYLVKHPRACKIALLDDTNLAPLLTGRTYPVYVLFDRSGNVIDTQTGAAGEPALRRFLLRAGL